jgi:multiple sugar transport system permease protein
MKASKVNLHKNKRVMSKWTWGLGWFLLVVNLLPLLWMLYTSLFPYTDLHRGKLIPSPRPNDIVYLNAFSEQDLMIGSASGGVYHYRYSPFGDVELSKRKFFSTMAPSYSVEDSIMWMLSADDGLLSINLNTMKTERRIRWTAIRRSFVETDFTAYIIPPEFPDTLFQTLAVKMNRHQLSKTGRTLSDLLGTTFKRDADLAGQLNALLEDRIRRQRIIMLIQNEMDWVNPYINELRSREVLNVAAERLLLRFMLAELFPNPLTRFEWTDWKDLWLSQVKGTAVTVTRDFIAFTVMWPDFPGLGIYNRLSGKIKWITKQQGLPETNWQSVHKLSDDHILLVGDDAMTIARLSTGRLERTFYFGQNGLPYTSEGMIAIAIRATDGIFLGMGPRLFYFDFASEQASEIELASDGLIAGLYVDSAVVALGTTNGVVILPNDHRIFTSPMTVDPVRLQHLFPTDQTENNWHAKPVLSIKRVEHLLFLGSTGGDFSVFDLQKGRVHASSYLGDGPLQLQWSNYYDLHRLIPFARLFINSFILCSLSVLLILFVAVPAAYSLTRLPLFGKNALTDFVLATQVIPSTLLLIPLFLSFSFLQQYYPISFMNNRWFLIATYTGMFSPLAIWLLRDFYKALPKALEEAAYMDGCSRFGAFVRIVFPNVWPGILSTGILLFLLIWDEMMITWIFVSEGGHATIPVGIRMYLGMLGNRTDLLMAACSLATLPLLILFFILQKYFVRGLTRNYEE